MSSARPRGDAYAFAALQLHEIPSATELVGMALIVAALVVNARA